MSERKNTLGTQTNNADINAEPQDRPSATRRALLTGGAVGLAAVAGSVLGGAQPASAQTNVPVTDWINVTESPYNADPTGQTPSAGGINQAIAAAAAQVTGSSGNTAPIGGVVYFPTGRYLVATSLTVPSGVTLMGAIPANAGALAAADDDYGSIIIPGPGFSGSNPTYPAVIFIDGSGSPQYRTGITNLWIDGINPATSKAGNAGTNGIAVLGGAFNGLIQNVGIINAPQSGIVFAPYTDPATGKEVRADGWTISNVIVEQYGNNPAGTATDPTPAYGIYWHGQDTQFVNVHVQAAQADTSTADAGCWYIDNGNDCRWIACRGDQGAYGWVFDTNPGGTTMENSPGSTQALIGCGTENTFGAALYLKNSNGQQMRTPVAAIGCSFDYPGRDGSSPAVLVTGYNILTMQGTNVTCAGPNNQFYPVQGLATAANPNGGVPALIDIDGGFWNVTTGPMVDTTAAQPALLRYRFYGYAGGNIEGGPTPTALTSFISKTWP